MGVENTSVIALRVPNTWRERWQEEARQKGITLSQLVKSRAIAASSGSNVLTVSFNGQQLPVQVQELHKIKMEEGMFDDQK